MLKLYGNLIDLLVDVLCLLHEACELCCQILALAVKLGCLLLGALGIANMWLAIFADVGVMVLAVLNAIRALFVKNL